MFEPVGVLIFPLVIFFSSFQTLLKLKGFSVSQIHPCYMKARAKFFPHLHLFNSGGFTYATWP